MLASLVTLECHFNLLSELPDLSVLASLVKLDCSWDKLEKMPDLSALVELRELYGYSEYLRVGDLSTLPNLNECDVVDYVGNYLYKIQKIRVEIFFPHPVRQKFHSGNSIIPCL